MARLNTRASTADTFYRDRTPTGTATPSRSDASPSPPTASFSSDKENRSSSRTTSGSKRTFGETSNTMAGGGKRRRLQEQGAPSRRRQKTTEAEAREQEDDDKRYYDPNQDPEERRGVRMAMRSNARELHERGDELLNDDGSALVGLINRQNSLMDKVKQTADATIDSRFLLNASEITLKKSRLLAFGDNALGIDIEEFVAKCQTFMMHGRALGGDEEEDEPRPTQARRNRRRANADDDSDVDDNDGNAFDWHVLGERACFPNNKRPSAPAFLLGPLSVEKRVRATQRRATQRRDPNVAASKPQELKEADLEANPNSNLSVQCGEIRRHLKAVMDAGHEVLSAEGSDDMPDDEAAALFSRSNLATNWEVPLLKFALNPNSFGQTVENLFYISFLVKDGLVKVNIDEESGFPTLRPQEQKTTEETRAEGGKKHQAIFSLDYGSWQIFKETMQISEPLIPHRQEETGQVNGRGWYG